jgi:hypothetical protein
MAKTIEEIANIWDSERKRLETELNALIAERDKFTLQYEASKEGGFLGSLKSVFDQVAPFSNKNRELNHYKTGIENRAAELQRNAGLACQELETIALEKYPDKEADARDQSMRQVISEIRSARPRVKEAAIKCREAANWTRNSIMSNDKTAADGISNSSTFVAQQALRDANRSLSNLRKYLEIPSYELEFLTELVGFESSGLAIALGYGKTSTTNSAGVQLAINLENAESIMKKISAQLDSLETKIQGKIDSRGAEALARLRKEYPDLSSLLNSLSDYRANR